MVAVVQTGTRAAGNMRNLWRNALAAAGRAKAMVMGAAAFAVTAGYVASAQAQQGLGDVLDRLSALGSNFYNLLGVIAAVGGACLAGAGLYKCYLAKQNPNDPSAKVSTGIVMIAIGSSMIALPEVFGVGITSLFGTGAETFGMGDDLEGIR